MTNVSVGPSSAKDPLRYDSRPELAIAALMYLMSRFPACRSPALANAIVTHLELVADDFRLAQALRDCAEHLVEDWRGYQALSADDDVAAGRAPS